MNPVKLLWPALFLVVAVPALGSPRSLLDGYAQGARTENPAFTSFSADRGRAFHNQEHTAPDGRVSSCATCHTANPAAAGKTRTQKVLQPLAPAANAQRFQDAATVEKWFLRNCHDVLQRPCTAQEKGDFLTYLLTVK
jgi:hypothetical protein